MRSLLLALILATSAASASAQQREVLVSAASSLTDVLQRLAVLYGQRSSDRLVLNLAASNTLARQVAAGARVDLFVSADDAQMDAVAADLIPGTRVDLLVNQLAIVVPDDRPARFTSARDLLGSAIRRIAMGDPAAVPAGVYARTYLQKAGLWETLQPKIVPAGSVRLALAAVESGAADAALVYMTDVATASRAHLAYAVPAAEGPRIVYPAAVLRTGRNPEGARRLLAFLRSAEAVAVFRRAGFGIAGGPAGQGTP